MAGWYDGKKFAFDQNFRTFFTLFSNFFYRNLRDRRTLHRIHHQSLQNHRRNLHLRLRDGHRDLLHTHLRVRHRDRLLRGVRIRISSQEFALESIGKDHKQNNYL